MLFRLALLGLLLAHAAAPGKAQTATMTGQQKRLAAAALDQRVGCAAFYRLTFDLLSSGRITERVLNLARSYDEAGKNMLVQASALAGALGESDATLDVRFKAALDALRDEIGASSVVYNQFARRLDPVCRRLIRR